VILFRQIDAPADEAEVITEVGEAIASNGAREWLWALGIMVVAIVASRIARAVLTRLIERTGSSSFLSDFLGRLLGYVVVAFGLVYALEEVGVEITPLLGALGLVGIALAFALQSILENFVAGVLLQVRRPFTTGDDIESQDYVGVITSIDARTMTICTPSGETVRLPNAEVIRNPIINLTENGHRRTTLPVGVAYGTDLQHAVEVTERAVRSANGVLEDPAPVVLVAGFGDSSIDLTAMFWHAPSIAEKLRAQNAVALAVARAFETNEITIPFPQRTLHLAADAASALAGDDRTNGTAGNQ
jgi:small-conductance mechanosensitive channel